MTTLSEAEIEKRRKEAGERAAAEAEDRRKAHAEKSSELPKEVGTRKGPEPTRYGDWEKKGIVSDF